MALAAEQMSAARLYEMASMGGSSGATTGEVGGSVEIFDKGARGQRHEVFNRRATTLLRQGAPEGHSLPPEKSSDLPESTARYRKF